MNTDSVIGYMVVIRCLDYWKLFDTEQEALDDIDKKKSQNLNITPFDIELHTIYEE